MTRYRLYLYGCTMALAVALAACSSGDSGPERGSLATPAAEVAVLTAAQIDAATAANDLQALSGPAQCDVALYAITYRTLGAHGEAYVDASTGTPVEASGAVLLPVGACAGTPAPLLAYAKGTDVRKPRTLADPQDTETVLLAAMYAAHGYAVVATDYLGYAQSNYSFHPYLHADSEASSVIDSIRAARELAAELQAPLSGELMVTGYSQGGHSAMATQRAIERDLGEAFGLVAGAHLAGPYDLAGSLAKSDLDQPIAGYQFFVPFMVTAWNKVYGNIYAHPTEIFKAPYAAEIEDLLPSPTLDYTTLVTSGALPGGTPREAQDALFDRSWLEDVKTNPANPFYIDATRNTLLGWTPVAPVLLCGGAGDPTVPPAMHQQPMMADFEARGVTGVLSVDVDALIQQTFGPGGVAPTDPASPEFALYYGSYHGGYEPLFCHAQARAFFDSHRQVQ